MSLAVPVSVTSTQRATSDHFTRPCANYRPSIWGDIFLQYDSQSLEVNDNMKQQAEILKEEVKKMFLSSSNNISQKLSLIDSIQHLGISHHFEREIDEALEQIHNCYTNNNLTEKEGGLHFLAVFFRLLRQNGYHISPDIFNQFKNRGKFNERIAQDVQGMLSLYEAAQLRVHGEDILEEALDFTYTNLKSMTNQLSPSLAAQINQSLSQPLHKEVPRIEARRYLSLYEEDSSHSKILLNFAKLDFNMLQKLHQKEVGSNIKWWKISEFSTKVPYARNRVVEGFFWALSMSSESKHSTARRIVSKLVGCLCILDDTYDAYGAVEELQLLTKAIQRWDISPIESLPECFKVVFNACVALCDEIELVITAKGGNSSLVLQYVKPALFNMAQSYLVEAKWCHEGYIPTYDEYKVNGVISAGYPLIAVIFIAQGEFATKEVFDWIFSNSMIMKAGLIGRLNDDLGSHKFEQQRNHVASGVECCMKQYNISQEEAYKFIEKEIEDSWKDINEEYLKSDGIPKHVLDCILGLTRVTHFYYANFEDRFTDGELMKDFVVAMLLDPIVV